MAFEINFDGLVGPTHNYSGLSFGNVASMSNRDAVSNPRRAALQGLEKMKRLSDLGLRQGVLPPQERPAIYVLKALGFSGKDWEILAKAAKTAPALLNLCSSASSMWAANAATVAPSSDTEDGKVHFTPANLSSKFHRSIEPPTTGAILGAIFSDAAHFVHHPPLPPGSHFSDEGAANHTRFCVEYGDPGLQLFVFGRYAFQGGMPEPKRFPGRQTFEASETIARTHGLDASRVLFAQQNPEAIDAGVFHNDVVAVGNRDVLFHHEGAFLNSEAVVGLLGKAFLKLTGRELRVITVKDAEVGLADAVKSYLFNTQLISLPGGKTALIAPMECQEVASVKRYLDGLLKTADSPIADVHYIDVRESMLNGGGPACLRLRVVLTEEEIRAIRAPVLLTEALYLSLKKWVEKHYRDRLTVADLADPRLLDECRTALDELTQVLDLGSLYPFQKNDDLRYNARRTMKKDEKAK